MYLVNNSKSPNYQVVYFVNGKRTTISTKTDSKKEADLFLNRFKQNNSKSNEGIFSPESLKPTSLTLEEFQSEYINYVKPIKSAAYIRSINLSFRQLHDSIGDIQLARINIRSLDNFITTTFKRTQRGSSLYYRTLKAAFSKAVDWGYIMENPFKIIKFPRIFKNHPIFISVEEFKLILSQTGEEFLRELFMVAFYTGMRQGELVNMCWDWIDFKDSLIHVKCSGEFQTKSKKERIIPINSNIEHILLNYKNNSINSFVFTNRIGIKLNENFVSKKFKKSVRAASLNDEIHFHTLRHSFASLLVQNGVSLYVVKELLGHEDLTTTQIYSHLNYTNLNEAINTIE